MTQPAYYFRYTLESAGPLNALSTRRRHEGALLRLGDGFGCIHPWPELGDHPLDEQLRLLQQGRTTSLTRQSLACCAADGTARQQRRSLFDGLTIPPSHATLVAFPSVSRCARLAEEGFASLKIKASAEDRDLPARLDQLATELDSLGLGIRLRLDFNATLTANATLDFLWSLNKSARQHLEFLEDPCPYHPAAWTALRRMGRIPLALDRCTGEPEQETFDVRIIKPAVQEMAAHGGRILATSYMDHPLGQMFAAWQAALHFEHCDACGLLTHSLFQPNPFSENLCVSGPVLHAPGGTGLGFDDLLEHLPWQRLN
ncbi:MAG: hypothetical protein KA004_11100 [Verrucomicrobiales bacterium]|nr:hypothetical protein [Verrucomicrobiales bacterium]